MPRGARFRLFRHRGEQLVGVSRRAAVRGDAGAHIAEVQATIFERWTASGKPDFNSTIALCSVAGHWGEMIRPLVLTLALALMPQITPAIAQTISGTASVTDGDGLEIHGQKIRLFGIDTVEGRQHCTLPDGKTWLCGKDAAVALADRIGRRPVTCRQQDYDKRWKRPVAICEEGGEDLGHWMVEQGWAMAYRRYSTDYVEAEERAHAAGRGLWASDFLPPWEWRKLN